jgi:hypothetical protein
VTPPELLAALLELAREVDLEVRRVPAEEARASAVCRVRDRFWVLLSAADPLPDRIAVVARALRTHAGEACEGRFLPPAVRAALEAEDVAEIVRRP